MENIARLALAVETLQTALSRSLFGSFAAPLVVRHQISRARPAR
jgi:hypothetical protein